jgi:hypothetical protein
VGIVVISLGLISLALDGGRLSRAALPALGAAVATGICIAGYTVIDAGAVRTTPVLVYAAWMFLLQGPGMPLIALLRRGPRLRTQAWPVLVAGLGGGVVSLAAYGLDLESHLVYGGFYPEGAGEMRAHPAAIRYALLACFIHQRTMDVIDHVVRMMLDHTMAASLHHSSRMKTICRHEPTGFPSDGTSFRAEREQAPCWQSLPPDGE